MNIYRYTIDKLKDAHRVTPQVLEDPRLLLLFVQLERAGRRRDFSPVELAIARMREYLRCQNREHLIVYGFLYVWFFDNTRMKHTVDTSEAGKHSLVWEYSSPVTREEHLISEWAALMYERHRKFCFRATR